MITICRTHSADKDFLSLVKMLDAELWQRYPEIHKKYEAHTRIKYIETVVVVYLDHTPVACGCFITHNDMFVEIKRMFVHPDQRGKGLSKTVLNALEQWASELGYTTSVLETGKKQPEAVGLYKKLGYLETENYGPYKDLEESLCFTKKLL